MIQILLPMIEPKLAFFQVLVERMLIHITKSIQSGFGEAPEAFNAIDMGFITNELILSVIDAQVLVPDPGIY